MRKICRLINTVRYLKARQIYFRVFYLSKSWFKKSKQVASGPLKNEVSPLKFIQPITKPQSLSKEGFSFLNKSKNVAKSQIDWNEEAFGLLWAYNLNYFDFLLQPALPVDEGLHLINTFIKSYPGNRVGSQAYPISLRGMNWIKFLSINKINSEQVNRHLFGQYRYLEKNLEYHILGNHLLENAFSLLFAAYYFKYNPFYQKSKKLLFTELNEQILEDGAHFELSPMYHLILLEHLLDTVNLLQNNEWLGDERLLKFLISKAKAMLSWLSQIIFKNRDIPYFNDASPGIAPSSEEIFDYAARLNISYTQIPLSESGYRRYSVANYEIVLDVGNIGPDYQPGHSHSDIFNFQLNIGKHPFIVDTGTSTYETGELRIKERATAAHNTVCYDGKEQSDVWDSFKVAKRAKIIHCQEGTDFIFARHDGYKKLGVIHERRFQFSEGSIGITDTLTGTGNRKGCAYLHFYPGILPVIDGKRIVTGPAAIELDHHSKVTVSDYNLCIGFNLYKPARCLKISFINYLKTIISVLIT